MKFKMHERSLFALLLRSPWWMSLLIAGGIGLLSRLLLPDDYRMFGYTGCAPFVGIALIALYKQLQRPSAARVAAAAGWLRLLHRAAGRQRRVAPGRGDSNAAKVRLLRRRHRPSCAQPSLAFRALSPASGYLQLHQPLAAMRLALCALRRPAKRRVSAPHSRAVSLGTAARAQRRRGRHPDGHDVRHRVRRGVPRGCRAAVRGASSLRFALAA